METSTALEMAIESATTVEGAEQANDCAETYSDSDRMAEGGNSRKRFVSSLVFCALSSQFNFGKTLSHLGAMICIRSTPQKVSQF